jgi:hypothetical protein
VFQTLYNEGLLYKAMNKIAARKKNFLKNFCKTVEKSAFQTLYIDSG